MTMFRATTMAIVLLLAALPSQAAKPLPLPRDSVYQLTLPLTDAQGRTQDWRHLQGKPRLVAMFYTSCPYMCPLIVESAKAVEHALPADKRGGIGIVLISIDPARDTPEALRAMAIKRHVDTDRWTLAAPAPGDVRNVAGVLGVQYRALADGNFNHTSALILIDAKGRIVSRTERMGASPDPEFLAAVKAQL